MKRTISVNIGGVPFVIDEDAYTMLSAYLSQIEGRLAPLERKEVMEDVEMRIAAIFSERLGVRNQVVDTSLVGSAISIIGSADDFGDAAGSGGNEESSSAKKEFDKEYYSSTRFYRSRTECVFGGVCGAIAPRLGIDVSVLRVLVVLGAFLSFSTLFWVYIVLWIVVPEEPINKSTQKQ